MEKYVFDQMGGFIQPNTVKLSKNPPVVSIHLHDKMPPRRPGRQVDEVPLAPVCIVTVLECAIAIDGKSVEKHLHGLIVRREKKTVIRRRIQRNKHAYPNVMFIVRDGNAVLWIEFPPLPLFRRKIRRPLRGGLRHWCAFCPVFPFQIGRRRRYRMPEA